MIKYFSLLLISAISAVGYSQVTVTNNLTVQQYVENVLLGSGVTVSNIQFNGIPANLVQTSVGAFNDPAGNVGLTSGFIMGSGDVQMAAQPNTGTGSTLGGTNAQGVDPDLQSITANQIFDECVIEFDFVPSGDTISFRYVFGSEEYPEYVCGTVNDAFGFFLTGTNPNGPNYVAKNLALIPDPNNPNVFTNTPVSINTVNPGVSGFAGNDTTCANVDPAWQTYNVFYAGTNLGVNYEYDGITVPLTAVAAVRCGETYHIKLAIGDAGDNVFDSGVFLEANSFNSSGLSIVANVVDTYEGCGNAIYIVSRTDTNSNHVVPLLIQGSAVNGEDYELITDSVVFEPGALTDTIYLNTIMNDDGGQLTEDVEILIDNTDACGGPIVVINNVDPMSASINLGDTLCPFAPMGETHTFTATVTGGIPLGYSYVWLAEPYYDFGWQQGQPSVVVAPGVTTVFQLVIGDICGNAVATLAEEVWVECLISIPNVFTPGNDGTNDFFVISNIEDYPNSELVIINRWGNVVYEVTGYKNDWKGDDLQEGVYFYKLYPNGRKYETGMYQGFFHIIR
jgi:gliding motility-associated-like protein